MPVLSCFQVGRYFRCAAGAPVSPSDVAQLYRNQGREVPAEFRVSVNDGINAILGGGPYQLPRKEKYGRVKKVIDGITFDSTVEAEAWRILKLWEAAGAITELEVQPAFQLEPGFFIDGKKVRAIKYRADFLFVKDGRKTVVDVKGVQTQAFVIKSKLFKARFPQLVFEIWDRAKVKELSRC